MEYFVNSALLSVLFRRMSQISCILPSSWYSYTKQLFIMHYKNEEFEVKLVSEQTFDSRNYDRICMILYAEYKKDFLNLVPFIAGVMFVPKDTNVAFLDLDAGYCTVANILKPEFIEAAIKTLDDDEINSSYFSPEYDSNNQHTIVAMARNLNHKILEKAGFWFNKPRKEVTTANKSSRQSRIPA